MCNYKIIIITILSQNNCVIDNYYITKTLNTITLYFHDELIMFKYMRFNVTKKKLTSSHNDSNKRFK